MASSAKQVPTFRLASSAADPDFATVLHVSSLMLCLLRCSLSLSFFLSFSLVLSLSSLVLLLFFYLDQLSQATSEDRAALLLLAVKWRTDPRLRDFAGLSCGAFGIFNPRLLPKDQAIKISWCKTHKALYPIKCFRNDGHVSKEFVRRLVELLGCLAAAKKCRQACRFAKLAKSFSWVAFEGERFLDAYDLGYLPRAPGVTTASVKFAGTQKCPSFELYGSERERFSRS